MKFIALVLILISQSMIHSAQAGTTQLMKYLKLSVQPLPLKKGSLVKSFDHKNQSYIYDQALAIIAFSKAKNKKAAKELLLALKHLQLPDGGFYFSYYLDGTSPYPNEGERKIAGSIAWVALAANHYQKEFSSPEFLPMTKKILSYLKEQILVIEIQDKIIQAIAFSPNDLSMTPWNETQILALEHNIDTYAAFMTFSKINNEPGYFELSQSLLPFIYSMWDKRRNHFWSGYNLKNKKINNEEFYLDNQTWTLLALDEKLLNDFSSKLALERNCQELLVMDQTIKGFMDSKPSRRPPDLRFVWAEGSSGQYLSQLRIQSLLNEKINCNLKEEDILTNIEAMTHENGGTSYATSGDHPDFTKSASVAATAWYFFALKKINPFIL